MLMRSLVVLGLVLCGAYVQAEEHAAPAEAKKEAAHDAPTAAAKPSAEEILKQLAAGNQRFREGKALGPHRDMEQVKLAAGADQANYALATILSCADSRVPDEIIFDVGVMDLFVVRVAGNVADTDEIGTIEYGVAHVNTPLLVVMGHSGCGAVKAVAASLAGNGHPLEKNIPPLVDNIAPAVQRAMRAHPEAKDVAVVPFAVEENVWQSVRDLFKRSAAVRAMVAEGKLKVVGAIYDLPSGEVKWLDPDKPAALLAAAEKDPKRSMEVLAGDNGPEPVAHGAAPEPAAAAEPAKEEAPQAPKPPAAPRPEIPVQVKGGDVEHHEEKH